MIKIVCVGKIKEQYLIEAIKEYQKRLSRFTKLQIIEVPDEKIPDDAGDTICESIKVKEGEKILAKIKNEYVISLEINGDSLTSNEFADKINRVFTYDNSDITFVIGGSLGLSKDVSTRANYHLSFSRMTFPHMLMRVYLLEQIYRAFKILRNEPYDK